MIRAKSLAETSPIFCFRLEPAVVTSDAQLSRLTTRAAIDLLELYPADCPVIEPATLVTFLTSTFRRVGVRPDLLDLSSSPAPAPSTTVPLRSEQGEVYPMGDLARERAIRVLAKVLESAASYVP